MWAEVWAGVGAGLFAVIAIFFPVPDSARKSRTRLIIVSLCVVGMVVADEVTWHLTNLHIPDEVTCVFWHGGSCDANKPKKPPVQIAQNGGADRTQTKSQELKKEAPPETGGGQSARVPTVAQQPAPTLPVRGGDQGVSQPVPDQSQTNTDLPPRVVPLNEGTTKDIWSTSVYSYVPNAQTPGPGGGAENDFLRVGGYGDKYVSLLQFDLPKDSCGHRVALQLYNKADGGGPTPVYVHLITQPWNWRRGDRLWWSDLPQSSLWKHRMLPSPDVNEWYSIDITDIALAWCRGDVPNYGIMLQPVGTFNTFDHFMSTRAADRNLRPRLLISS